MRHTYKDKLTIYVDPETKALIPEAKQIFARENSSLSKFLSNEIREYVRLHAPGNPQQTLDVINKLGKAYRAETCQLCGLKPVHFGMEKGMWLGFCSAHFNKRKFNAWK